MTQKHYNIQISVQEVTEAAPERIERGARVEAATPRTHRELLSVALQQDDLAAAVARGIDVLHLLKPKGES